MNWRDIPTPEYGNYGGGYNTDENFLKSPIDEMDAYFKLHDLHLKHSKSKLQRYLADSTLFFNLKSVNLNNLKHPIYGRLYWLGALVAFGIIHSFGKPSE